MIQNFVFDYFYTFLSNNEKEKGVYLRHDLVFYVFICITGPTF